MDLWKESSASSRCRCRFLGDHSAFARTVVSCRGVTPIGYVRHMVCCSCARPASFLCETCRYSLRPIAPRSIGGSVVVSAFAHRGAAVRLVHSLKYRRNLAAARFLALAIVEMIGSNPTCVVPIPRALTRRIVFGIDPARTLSDIAAAQWGVPRVDALATPIWRTQQAGKGKDKRSPIAFVCRIEIPDGAVIVDDVVTTGGTVSAALAALGSRRILVATATSAGTMAPEAGSARTPGGGVAQQRSTRAMSSHPAPLNPASDTGRGLASVRRALSTFDERSTGDRSRPR